MITITATCSKCGYRLTNAGTTQVVIWHIRHRESCLGEQQKSIEVG